MLQPEVEESLLLLLLRSVIAEINGLTAKVGET